MVKLASIKEAIEEHDAFIEAALSSGDCPIIFIAIVEIGSEFYYELIGLGGDADTVHRGLDEVYMDTATAEELARRRRLTIMR